MVPVGGKAVVAVYCFAYAEDKRVMQRWQVDAHVGHSNNLLPAAFLPCEAATSSSLISRSALELCAYPGGLESDAWSRAANKDQRQVYRQSQAEIKIHGSKQELDFLQEEPVAWAA